MTPLRGTHYTGFPKLGSPFLGRSNNKMDSILESALSIAMLRPTYGEPHVYRHCRIVELDVDGILENQIPVLGCTKAPTVPQGKRGSCNEPARSLASRDLGYSSATNSMQFQASSPPSVDRIWAWVYYNTIPIHPIFYLLKGDHKDLRKRNHSKRGFCVLLRLTARTAVMIYGFKV